AGPRLGIRGRHAGSARTRRRRRRSVSSAPRRDRGYWNPRTELMPRPELEALQLHRLQRIVSWAHDRSPFWRRKLDAAGVSPDAIQKLDDVRRLPFLTKSEL